MTATGVLWLVAGLVAGWLINYFADVLPINRKFEQPICLNCGSRRSLGDYLLLRGCETCGKRRGLRSGLVLFLYIFIGGLLWLLPPSRINSVWAMILLVLFGIIVVIDIEHRLILHVVSLSGAIFGLILGVQLHGWVPTLVGGAAGFAIMLGLFYFGVLFGRLLSKMKGEPIEEVALGFGDVNLSGVLGLILGWPGITACLLGAILLGGVVSGFYLLGMYLLKRYKPFTALPYAPFLIASALLLLFRPA